MKILVFGNACGFGGAQKAFHRLVDFFLAERHSVSVVGLVGSNDRLPASGSIIFGSRVSNESWRFTKLKQILRAAQVARGFEPDLFVTVGLAKTANLIARHLPRRTFRVAQDFIFGRTLNDPLFKPLRRSFDALALQAPSMVGALSVQGFKAVPLSWLPCFPDPPISGFRRMERNGRAGIRLAYFGRLASNKGIDLLMHALTSAKLALPTTLDVWGGGSELEPLKQLALKLRCNSTVQFFGNYPEGPDYAKLICSYDGLVLPSTGLEGLPLILLEAMAYGVPFLSTRVGAIPDCANEDAILVDPSLDRLRPGLEQFVARLAVDSFSTVRLQRHYESRFSVDVMANRWREMILDPKGFFSHYG